MKKKNKKKEKEKWYHCKDVKLVLIISNKNWASCDPNTSEMQIIERIQMLFFFLFK